MHAAEFPIGVVRFPCGGAFDFSVADGTIGNDGAGAHAFVEGGEVNEGFEDRADLAAGLDGTVEFGFVGIAPAYESEDAAGAVFDSYGGARMYSGSLRWSSGMLCHAARVWWRYPGSPSVSLSFLSRAFCAMS